MNLKVVILAVSAALTGCQETDRSEFPPESDLENSTPGSIERSSVRASKPYSLGSVVTMDSEILNEPRDLYIYVPESANETADRSFRYPTVYLLDGDANFEYVASLVNQLSGWRGDSHIPEMIVVGIPNTDRLRDLTPTQASRSSTSGGGKEFISYIESELIPFMESNYPSNNHRTFIGHSLGGLMVIDTLLERPELFRNYLAIDPSLWWDDQLLVEKSKTLLNRPVYEGRSLYLAVANTTLGLTTVSEAMDNNDERTQHIRSMLEFADIAEDQVDNGLKFLWKYYDEERHITLPPIAEYDALKFFFEWHSWSEIAEEIVTDTTSSGDRLVSLVTAHYDRISQELGQTYLPIRSAVNAWGQEFLREDRPDVAHAFFSLNLENFPNNAETYESLGDYFRLISSSELARENYSRARELGGSDSIDEKISDLDIQ